MNAKVAVIGAGIAGIQVAKGLSEFAHVTLLEKSRGFGGRMATRTRGVYQLDHGAPYFQAHNSDFCSFLEPLVTKNYIATWQPRIKGQDHSPMCYVGVPKMSSLCRNLAQNLEVRLETKLDSIRKEGSQWSLYSGQECLGVFDWVVFTTPSHQAAELLPDAFLYKDAVASVVMDACFSIMIGSKKDLNLEWDIARDCGAIIDSVVVNSSKPKRSTAHTLVGYSHADWAHTHIDDESESVQSLLLTELERVVEQPLKQMEYVDVHRWRYASSKQHSGPYSYTDQIHQLAVCGDWCVDGTVEGAFVSANNLLQSLTTLLHHKH